MKILALILALAAGIWLPFAFMDAIELQTTIDAARVVKIP